MSRSILSRRVGFAGEVDAAEVDHLPYFATPEVEMLFQVMPLMQRCDRQRCAQPDPYPTPTRPDLAVQFGRFNY